MMRMTRLFRLFLAIHVLTKQQVAGWMHPSPLFPPSQTSRRNRDALLGIVRSRPTSLFPVPTRGVKHMPRVRLYETRLHQKEHKTEADEEEGKPRKKQEKRERKTASYDLGIGKNGPFSADDKDRVVQNWVVPESVQKPSDLRMRRVEESIGKDAAGSGLKAKPTRTRKMVARDNASQRLRGALWDEQHYDGSVAERRRQRKTKRGREVGGDYPAWDKSVAAAGGGSVAIASNNGRREIRSTSPRQTPYRPTPPALQYPDIDLSIPDSVYSDDGAVDLVWDILRWEAHLECQREPLLVSFLYSTILNHDSLESSLAFLLANRLQSPAMMISTQLQSLIFDALLADPVFRRSLRADIMAVRDRDPACNRLPDVFLYFKGFHALQSHRVANVQWRRGRRVLAQYLQSQVSQTFQIDIHPNATLGSGIMLDHGTGIVIGETAVVGHNCSILHHVTLGGSGKKGVHRHPVVGDGVLLGAGATVLGPVRLGEGSQVGAGTLVISDLPAHCVAVGVPARVIGSFVDVTEQPSVGMDHNIMEDKKKIIATFESAGI